MTCLLTTGFFTAIVFFIYTGTLSHDFINFDDPVYVTDNPAVKNGITYEGIAWAFGIHSDICMYWQPVAWLSHMLDAELFGLDAGKHHLSSVLLHLLNVLMLYYLLLTTTGSKRRSLFVAALFAVHPVNVDPVTWIAERKTILSGFFWLAGFITYKYYCKTPGFIRYFTVLLLFTLGLLTKPVMATFPCALLLFDIWPLKRLDIKNTVIIYKRFIEKLPFFFIFGLWFITPFLSSTLLANKTPSDLLPLSLRISNALVAYTKYIGKFFFPVNLSIHYPYPDSIPVLNTLLATAVLILLTIIFLKRFKRQPWLIIGWLWFLGVLFPSSGLIHGTLWPEMADRWAYLPYIGLCIILSWGLFDLIPARLNGKKIQITVAVLFIISFTVLAKKQTTHWKNSITVFNHALSVVGYDSLFHQNISAALIENGEIVDALRHQQRILSKEPENADASYNVGLIYNKLNKPDKALHYFSKVIKIRPEDEKGYMAAAELYAGNGNEEKAIELYQEAFKRCLRIPSEMYYNISVILNRMGRYQEAEIHLLKLLGKKKGHVPGILLYADILLKRKDCYKAGQYFTTASRYDPDSAAAYNGIGISYACMKQYDKAIEAFNRSLSIDPTYEKAAKNLHNAIIQQSRLDKAD